jgi:mannose-6-phosphate isomerase-like protein (cupin superfamily)
VTFEATVVAAGGGRPIWQLGNDLWVKADGGDTRGAYALLEQTCAGAPPPLHVHEREEEAFYVLEGSLELHVGDSVTEAGPGSFCLVPRGTPHTFRSRGDDPARLLVILSPPGFERFFDDCEHAFPREGGMPHPEEAGAALGAMAGDHALRIVGPPPS